jgi:hypothetical protein
MQTAWPFDSLVRIVRALGARCRTPHCTHCTRVHGATACHLTTHRRDATFAAHTHTLPAHACHALHTRAGASIVPGTKVQAGMRFVPRDDASNMFFIKLADGRGWVPVRK